MSMNGNDGHLSHDAATADILHGWMGTRVHVILADITNVVAWWMPQSFHSGL